MNYLVDGYVFALAKTYHIIPNMTSLLKSNKYNSDFLIKILCITANKYAYLCQKYHLSTVQIQYHAGTKIDS